jgi:hypothetical protein
MTPTGFPHSDIPGSKLVCSSPRLIAAYHVLRRLLVPRHPPCALSSLTGISKVHSLCISQRLVFGCQRSNRDGSCRHAARVSIDTTRERSIGPSKYDFDEPALDSGGDSGARTRNLRLAKPALSQLSYIPETRGAPRIATRPRAWWAWVDSNHPPHAYQACALTN